MQKGSIFLQDVSSLLQLPYLLPVLFGCNLLLLLVVIIQGLRISRLQRRMQRFFSKSDGGNIEATLVRLLDQLEESKKKQDELQFALGRMQQKMASQSGNLAVLRYNAFGDIGSDLSFSIALLDDQQNGVVVTSIYGREESRIYAKPIEGGNSVYNLSEEELAVIKKATNAALSKR